MNRFALVLAATLVLTACTEPTVPATTTSDFAVRLARKVTTPPVTVTGNLQNSTFTFTADDYGVTNAGPVATALDVRDAENIASSSVVTEETPATRGNYVLGRLNNQQIVIGIASGATEYSVDFDFYAIGSWDGKGQQAQHGAFGQDSWQIAAECGSSLVNIFITSFSNQKTVQQNYPRQVTDAGGSQWLTGSSDSNVTGFTANVPLFSSVIDSWYELKYSGVNPCPSGEAFTAIKIFIPGFDLQSRSDEAWAIDNLNVLTDNN